jgi:response regulator of citrate/malate metabolism
LKQTPLRVVVTDDDFMIAKLHGKFVESQPHYQVMGIANDYKQTLAMVKNKKPDLLLLDVYLPDKSGIEVLREIRMQNIPCDVILITAAKEVDVVQEGFRLGIFDYLIKPFDLDHLKNALGKYAQYKSQINRVSSLDQSMVDDLKKLRAVSYIKPATSGVDVRTLERIKNCLRECGQPKSAVEIANLAGVSRSTARTYLAYLVEEQVVKEELIYGTIGRPQKVFTIHQ